MGGPTGETKNKILVLMEEAVLQGTRVSVSQLAEQLRRKVNTISEHMSDLAKSGLIKELMRGQWELTNEGLAQAQALKPARMGIEYVGYIAAGPAIPITEALGEQINLQGFDPEIHFAMRVQGTSMVSYGILNDDVVIFRRTKNWLEVPEGKIVAAYVPEGTDLHSGDWLDHMERVTKLIEGGQEPALDHITLKKLDLEMRSYLRQGLEESRIAYKLKGSQGTIYPIAIAIAGFAVHLFRDIH